MKSAVVDFGIQWACFAVAAALKTEKFFDLAGECHFFSSKVHAACECDRCAAPSYRRANPAPPRPDSR